jgi:hypothetical protein
MCKDGFYFHSSFKRVADKLPDDMRLKFYDALIEYGLYGIEPEDEMLSLLIEMAKPLMEYEEPSKRGGRREGAGAPVGNNNAQKQSKTIKNNQINQNNQTEQKETKKNTPLNPQEENNKNIYTPITPNGVIAPNGGLPTESRFKKPTVEEVKSYFAEKNLIDESEQFWDFYECKGWKVGKNPMKDWRAAVRNWGRRNTSNIDEQKEREKLSAAISQHWGDDE